MAALLASLIEPPWTGRKAMTQMSREPYTLVGAEQLTASVYKIGAELTGSDYRFNIARPSNRTGCVKQWFRSADLISLVKVTRVLAAELVADGCLDTDMRRRLRKLSDALDIAIANTTLNSTRQGASDQ